MNLIIAGSRTFLNYELLHEQVKVFMAMLKPAPSTTVIISGGADGADKLGEQLARQYIGKVGLKVMNADWSKFGAKAGYLRNEQMAEIADACIIFCVLGSRGSTHMRDIAMAKNIPVAFVEIDPHAGFTVTYTGVTS